MSSAEAEKKTVLHAALSSRSVQYRDPPVGRLPGPGVATLVVEVADTSLAYERNVKLARYSEAGIPENMAHRPERGSLRGPLPAWAGRLPQDHPSRGRRYGSGEYGPQVAVVVTFLHVPGLPSAG